MEKRWLFLIVSTLVILSMGLTSCAPATPQIVEVEKQVPVEKKVVETVVVEKEVPVEKKIVETVIVEKEKIVTKEVEKQVVVTATPVPKPPVEKTLIVASAQEPDNLFSLMGNMKVVTDLQSFIYRRVIEFANDNLPHCVLCEELPSLQNGLWKIDEAKGTMELTYRLKKGLKWADGKEITAKDVVFAFELMSDSQYEYGASYIQPLERIEAKDDYTFVAYYSSLYPYADVETFKLNIVPEHFYRPIWDKYKAEGGTYWKRFIADERVAIKPLVNGPFMVQEWVQGSHITLVRNPNYNIGAQPKIEKIVWRFIPDTNTLTVNVATRQVHLTDGWLSLEQARALETAPGVKVLYVPVIWLEHATLQINQPPLDDKRVRQALMYGMDREAINQAIFQGKQPPADSWLPPDHPAYNPDVKKYPYDPEKAKALLEEAGWKLGADGIRRNAKGDKLTITYVSVAGDRVREQVAAAIQSNWKDIGIEVKIEPQTARLLFSETLPQNKLVAGGVAVWRWVIAGSQEAQVGHSFWYPSNEPGANYDLLREDSVWGKIERNKQLLDEAIKTIDKEKRYALLREQQAIWAEELPVLPLYWHRRVASVDERLQGYAPSTEACIGWNVEQWDIVMP